MRLLVREDTVHLRKVSYMSNHRKALAKKIAKKTGTSYQGALNQMARGDASNAPEVSFSREAFTFEESRNVQPLYDNSGNILELEVSGPTRYVIGLALPLGRGCTLEKICGTKEDAVVTAILTCAGKTHIIRVDTDRGTALDPLPAKVSHLGATVSRCLTLVNSLLGRSPKETPPAPQPPESMHPEGQCQTITVVPPIPMYASGGWDLVRLTFYWVPDTEVEVTVSNGTSERNANLKISSPELPADFPASLASVMPLVHLYSRIPAPKEGLQQLEWVPLRRGASATVEQVDDPEASTPNSGGTS